MKFTFFLPDLLILRTKKKKKKEVVCVDINTLSTGMGEGIKERGYSSAITSFSPNKPSQVIY